jgi:hypothetical protein
MLSLLIPFIALLARVQALDLDPAVTVDFASIWTDVPKDYASYVWEDITKYESGEDKTKLSAIDTDDKSRFVGHLNFTRTYDQRTIRYYGTPEHPAAYRKVRAQPDMSLL